ncbi:MAG TPA: cytochrome c peroxidase, partial [Bacteroidia bacterium]|nr:cytochrome c peroxidase [Bacteroidia bacterium]
NWPKPIYDFEKNPLTAKKIDLGRILFYDPILSQNNTISCASCHSPYSAFTHIDHDLSHGINDRIGIRNSPALMNLAWQPVFMWDGAVNHLDVQALAPISHPDEMGEKIENVILKLQRSKNYPLLFLKAFDDSNITGEHILKALSQFMLTLISANSKYDSVMRKQTKFTLQEENGYKLFQKNCASCHKEPLFSNFNFENNGLPVDTTLKDYGRMKITKNKMDSLKFKVPTLRNIEFSFPYMHDGRFKRLSEVLKHYTTGIQKSATLSKNLDAPIILTSNEKVDLIAFLLTLTDKAFIYNTNHNDPKNNLTLRQAQSD